MIEPEGPKRNKPQPGAEGLLEGKESILRSVCAMAEREERFKRLFPEAFKTLTCALRELRLPAPMVGYAAFHPISCRAVESTLTEFAGKTLLTDEEQNEFAARVSLRTIEILRTFDSLPSGEVAKMLYEYPEVDIRLLRRSHAQGIITETELLDSFQFQTSLESALRKIATHRLTQETKLP